MHLNRWCHVFVRVLVFRSYTLNNPKSLSKMSKCIFLEFTPKRWHCRPSSQWNCSETVANSTDSHRTTSQQDTPESVLYVLLVLKLFRSGRKDDSVKNVQRQFIKNRIELSNQIFQERRCRLHFWSFFSPSEPHFWFWKLLHAQSSVRPFPVLCLLWLAHQIFSSNLRSSLLILLNSASYKEVRPLSCLQE